MPKYRNKKTARNIRSQRERRKSIKSDRAKRNGKIFFVVSFTLFVSGIFLSLFSSIYAVLTLFFPFVVGTYIVNAICKKVFGREYEYHSNYSGKTMRFGDIVLTVPLLAIGLYPMFIVGEISDCRLNTEVWAVTIGYCK